MAYRAKATEKCIGGEICWFVRCPECKCKWQLDECPAPGGMALNIEPCPECGADIQILEGVPRNEIPSRTHYSRQSKS